MIRRITVEQLRVGMYVQEFVGSWLDHPFWRSHFLIRDAEELQRIQHSGVRELLIDTAKGADLPPGAAEVPSQEERDAPAGKLADGLPSPVSTPLAHAAAARLPVALSKEVARAARLCADTREAVMSMFQEVRMGKAVDAQSAGQLVDEISDSVARNVHALISIARLKTADNYTYMHSVAVCAMMIVLGRQLHLDEEQVRLAGTAGLLHDLGKAFVPSEILNKPGKLTDAEFDIIKSHPRKGWEALQAAAGLDPVVLDVCLHHHEKVDGSGYPERLKDEAISVYAKMGAVCDVYDAITSNRPYKAGWDPAESLHRMAGWHGHFDPPVFQAFVRSLGIYPVGSLVRLSSERLAVVVAQSGGSLIAPVVKVFYSLRAQMRLPVEALDLSAAHCADKIVQREDPQAWRFPDLDALWSEGAV